MDERHTGHNPGLTEQQKKKREDVTRVTKRSATVLTAMQSILADINILSTADLALIHEKETTSEKDEHYIMPERFRKK